MSMRCSREGARQNALPFTLNGDLLLHIRVMKARNRAYKIECDMGSTKVVWKLQDDESNQCGSRQSRTLKYTTMIRGTSVKVNVERTHNSGGRTPGMGSLHGIQALYARHWQPCNAVSRSCGNLQPSCVEYCNACRSPTMYTTFHANAYLCSEESDLCC